MPFTEIANKDDFVFKTATSPKLELKSSFQDTETTPTFDKQANFDSISSSISSMSVSCEKTDTNSTPSIKTNRRIPYLDSFISEKKREMDSQLAQISKERLSEYIKQEKSVVEDGEQRDFTFQLTLPIEKNEPNNISNEIDLKEQEIFERKRKEAQLKWTELKKEYDEAIQQKQTEQAVKLSQETQLQESIKACGSVFDLELFEKVVDKCGKGRNSVYGRERMARFWEVLDRDHRNSNFNSGSGDKHKKTAEDDKILAALLG